METKKLIKIMSLVIGLFAAILGIISSIWINWIIGVILITLGVMSLGFGLFKFIQDKN